MQSVDVFHPSWGALINISYKTKRSPRSVLNPSYGIVNKNVITHPNMCDYIQFLYRTFDMVPAAVLLLEGPCAYIGPIIHLPAFF